MILMSMEVQDYLFSTQDLLQEYISIEDEIFTPLRDTLDNRNYKSFSNQLLSINEKLINGKKVLSKTIRENLLDKERKLVEVTDQYVDKLSITILQLNYISTRLIDVFSYQKEDYSEEIDKFYDLKDEHIKYGRILNTHLEDFLITPPTDK